MQIRHGGTKLSAYSNPSPVAFIAPRAISRGKKVSQLALRHRAAHFKTPMMVAASSCTQRALVK